MTTTHPPTIYCAPLQGFTDWAWRKAHWQMFGGVCGYYTPFIRVAHGEVRRHDVADVLPAHNSGVPVIPQILGCNSNDARHMALQLRDMGYSQIDINLGCPHPPVALHHKGAGMLPYPAEVEQMFEALAAVDGVRYSVKMRIGWEKPDEWRAVLPLLCIVKPTHVTLHPRTGRERYQGALHLDQLDQFVGECIYPVVANGDILSSTDVAKLHERHPTLAGVMIGRALVANPALLVPERATAGDYRRFHDMILDSYMTTLTGGDNQILMKMKSLWQLMLPDTPSKMRKAIKKSRTLAGYRETVSHIFR